jgi:uncharacterized membrane protein YozB (DUF420 family)
MIRLTDLPTLNAVLNAAAAVLIISGLICIKLRKPSAHMAFMILALLVSAAFLAGYITYHASVGHVTFNGKGWIRWVYFPLLISHILLAVATAVMVPMTVVPALRRKFDRHKRLAKWTAPVWLYVSVTGVLVYLMAHIWFA